MVHWHVFAHSAAALVGLARICRVRRAKYFGVRCVWICLHTRNQPPICDAICAKHSLVRLGHHRVSIVVWIVGRPQIGHARLAWNISELVRLVQALATFIFYVPRRRSILDHRWNNVRPGKLCVLRAIWFGRAERSTSCWNHDSNVFGMGRAIHGLWIFAVPRA